MSKALVVLIPGFPSDELDSTCLPASQAFIRSLNNLFPSLNIIVCSFQYPHRKDCYRWYGNTVYSFNSKRVPKWLRPLVWYEVYRMLNRVCQNHEVIGVLSFWCLEEALVGRLFCQRKKLKHYAWMLGQDARASNFFIRLFRPKTDSLVAMSEAIARESYRNHSLKPAYIIPNGVDTRQFPSVSSYKEIDLLAVGSLTPLKRYHIFVDVVAQLREQRPSIKAMIIGNGPEEENLKALIDAYQLRDHIELLGECPHVEVLLRMTQSKMLVHPSSYEGYSTVCLEALYAGCHVVSFTQAEHKEIPHWHVVNDAAEMITTCLTILDRERDFSAVLVHEMDSSAREMMRLYNYPEEITE